MFKKSCLAIFSLMFMVLTPSVVVAAGTIIKIQDGNEVTTMFTDGKRARINMSVDEYVIVEFASHTVKMVTPQKKQVMVFSTKKNTRNKRSSGNASLVKLSLDNKSETRNIAGYQSDKYEYAANGKTCGIVYASKSALQEKGIKALIEAMQAMIDQQRDIMGGFAALVDDCKLADMQLTEKMHKIGIPMLKEENGRVITRVTSIEVDVSLPADTFAVPASYKNTTIEEQMQQAFKGAQGQRSPQQQMQMRDMMQQMQQSGQISPEMMQQMQRAQGMMQQYQRP